MMIQFYQSLNVRKLRREWRWRARHSNGKIMANGAGDGFVRLVDCEQSVRTLGQQFNEAIWEYPNGFKLADSIGRRNGLRGKNRP